MDKHILVFGTSITYGAWDSEGGWVARLRKFLDKKTISSNYKNYGLIYNLGVDGDKTEDVLKRFEPETKARLEPGNETIVIFHVGINDIIFNDKLNSTEVSPEQFGKNLKLLLDKAKIYSKKIILVSYMPVDKRVDPIPWSPGRSYKNEFLGEFDKIMASVSKNEGAHFIEVFKKFIDSDYSSLLADGVHMNDKGHKKLYELVRDYLLREKII